MRLVRSQKHKTSRFTRGTAVATFVPAAFVVGVGTYIECELLQKDGTRSDVRKESARRTWLRYRWVCGQYTPPVALDFNQNLG